MSEQNPNGVTFRERIQRIQCHGRYYASAVHVPTPLGRSVTYLTAVSMPKPAASFIGFRNDMSPGDTSTVGDWIPADAPSMSDNFRGINRSYDTVRLAGNRIIATGKPRKEALIDGVTRVALEGGRPDQILVPSLWGMHREKILGPFGQWIECLVEPGLAGDTAFVVQSDTWAVVENGNGHGSLVCHVPAYNCRVTADAFAINPNLQEGSASGMGHAVSEEDVYNESPPEASVTFGRDMSGCSNDAYEVRVVGYYGQIPAGKMPERACKSCGKPNDIGIKSCWWCETANPTTP